MEIHVVLRNQYNARSNFNVLIEMNVVLRYQYNVRKKQMPRNIIY